MKREYQIKYAAENSIRYANIFNELDSRDIIYKKAFEAGAEWMQEKMVEKAIEYAKARYDLDYCGNVRDILDYLKSLTEE